MTTKTNTAAILSAMTPDFAAQVLSTMSPTEAAATLAEMNGSTPAPARRTEKTGTKSLRGQVTNDGTNRNASEFIRDCDASLSAKEVCEAAAAVGLVFKDTYVHNVRAMAKKKAAETVTAEEAAKADEAKKEKLRANLEKARAAKAAKKAEAEAAANAATAKASKGKGRKSKGETAPAADSK